MAEGPKKENAIWRLGVKLAHTRLKAAMVARTRLLLLIMALLTLFLAFKLGQDYYVEEFATYDWARDLGF